MFRCTGAYRRRRLLAAGLAALMWSVFQPAEVVADRELPEAAAEADRPLAAGPAAAADEEDREYYQLFRLLAETLDQVERNYVKEVDRRELVEAAIRGMLSELDQYSSYIPPQQLDRFRTGVEAEFGGVGIQVSVEEGELRVISPIIGSPAYRSGLMAGDVIVEIGGTSAAGISIDQAIELMKGPAGTDLTIKVQHPGQEDAELLTLKREIIRVDTVMADSRNADASWKWMYDEPRRIAYVRVTAFGRHTAEELRKVLQELVDQRLSGLVLDLRFNPGGLLSTAIEVCDLFISSGRIVSTAGRSTAPRSWDAEESGTVRDFPLAILVNRYSASASEIVAACLQDHARGVVIGERTWGKGSVQNVVEMEEGASALKLTTAEYRRPSGKNIHRFPNSSEDDDWGVKPNEGYEVKLSTAEMSQLLEQRRQKDVVRRPGDEAGGPQELDATAIDRQLQAALDYLKEQLEKGEVPQEAEGGGTLAGVGSSGP